MNDHPSTSPRGPTPLPRWAERLLRLLIPAHHRDIVIGDFAERFGAIAAMRGRGRALWWYWGQVLKSTPAFIGNGIYFGGDMVRNYLKIALRNLFRRKFYAALNIGGLAVGMAACLLIFQYVAFEHSFDTFHENRTDLYRIATTDIQNDEAVRTDAYTWHAMGEALKEVVPELKNYARFHPNYGAATVAYTDAQGQRKALREEGLYYADASFLTMFSFPLVQGDPATALADVGTLVLSESAARKYFGSEEPIGQALEVRGWASGTYTVTGVFEDVPANSHLQFDLLLPMADLLKNGQYEGSSGWGWSNFITYVYLHPEAVLGEVERKMEAVVRENKREALERRNARIALDLEPLEALHLFSGVEAWGAVSSNYKTVYFFTLVALFILLIAWVNYVNLSTALAAKRAKEVGVRKVVGARKMQVVLQFLFESALMNAVALALAVGLAVLGLPYLNDLAGAAIPTTVWQNPWFWGGFLGFFVVGVLLSSLYPAAVLSAFKPATVLKGGLGSARTRNALRKGLVVFQFAASIALLTGTCAVYWQVDYMRGLDLGIDIDQVLVVSRPSLIEEGRSRAEAREVFKAELSSYPAIRKIAISSEVPGGGFTYGGRFRRESAPSSEAEEININWINYDFLDTYDLALAAGRTFSPEITTDSTGVLLNETAVRNLGFDTNEAAVGQHVVIGGSNEFHVVGVLKDFHWMSMKQAIESYGFLLAAGQRYYSLKVQTTNLDATLAAVRSVYDEVFPGNPFDYFFVDRFFDEQYKADQQFGTLFGIFALFAIFVACLGLVGLAAITASQRTKEIGVRKVLGASAGSIVGLLLRDFGKLILAALVLTLPLSYFALDSWLAGFAARIDLTVWLFLIPGLVVMLLALLTVTYHTTRAALTNPVDSLRYE